MSGRCEDSGAIHHRCPERRAFWAEGGARALSPKRTACPVNSRDQQEAGGGGQGQWERTRTETGEGMAGKTTGRLVF